MSSVKNWIEASRLRTLPLALSSIFMGSAFISKSSHFYAVLALASITTLLLQVLSNLANDYGDFQMELTTKSGLDLQEPFKQGLFHLKA